MENRGRDTCSGNRWFSSRSWQLAPVNCRFVPCNSQVDPYPIIRWNNKDVLGIHQWDYGLKEAFFPGKNQILFLLPYRWDAIRLLRQKHPIGYFQQGIAIFIQYGSKRNNSFLQLTRSFLEFTKLRFGAYVHVFHLPRQSDWAYDNMSGFYLLLYLPLYLLLLCSK